MAHMENAAQSGYMPDLFFVFPQRCLSHMPGLFSKNPVRTGGLIEHEKS